MSLEQAREDFQTMFLALREDAVHWLPGPGSLDTPFRRRAFVRATMAFVEGVSFSLRRLALAMYEAGEAEFTPEEVGVLRERSYGLDGGRVTPQKLKLRTQDAVRFAFHACARAHGLDLELDVSRGDGWQALQRAIEVRDRLVHPKTPPDLQVSDLEVEIVNAAGRWIQDGVIELLERIMRNASSTILRLTHQTIFDQQGGEDDPCPGHGPRTP